MSTADILIIFVICGVLAIAFMCRRIRKKNGRGCEGCGGACSGCDSDKRGGGGL